MKPPKFIFQDFGCNRGRPMVQVLLVLFRAAQLARRRGPRALSILTAALYRSYAIVLLSVDIPVSTTVGPRLRIHHGFGLVIHDRAQIGADVTLRHGVTLGARASGETGVPSVGDRVEIGAGAMLIGPIRVNDEAIVGANAVVTRSVDAGATVSGSPARPTV